MAAGESGLEPGLLEALEARHGIVCLVGAGGKKTLLRRLAEAQDLDPASRVALTTSTRMKPFEPDFALPWVVAESGPALAEAVVARAPGERRLGYGGPVVKKDRQGGIEPALIAEIHARAGFTATYVKADGARMRWLKGQREDEPRLVPGCGSILLLASLKSLGRPLDERIAHRPEIVSELSGCALDEAFKPEHLARLLGRQSERLRAASGATVIPVLNMADDEALRDQAGTVAKAFFAESPGFSKVAVTCLLQAPPFWQLLGAR